MRIFAEAASHPVLPGWDMDDRNWTWKELDSWSVRILWFANFFPLPKSKSLQVVYFWCFGAQAFAGTSGGCQRHRFNAMKVYLALSLAFVCLVRGDDVHHLRGDAQKSTATEMPVPANDEVGAVGNEPSQKQEVAETPKGTENEASPTPAEEVGAVAKEPETNGNDKLPTQENAKGTEHEAQVENGKEAGVVAKEPSPKDTAAKPQQGTPPRTGVHEPDEEAVYALYYPEEEEWGYDYGPDEDIPEWDDRAQWDFDDYDYPDPEDFEEPVVKESDPSDPSHPSGTEAVAASAATAGAAVAAGKQTTPWTPSWTLGTPSWTLGTPSRTLGTPSRTLGTTRTTLGEAIPTRRGGRWHGESGCTIFWFFFLRC